MKELTQANVNVLGERVRCLMGNAAESSLALMIRDLGKQISECGENRLDVVFRLGFELDDRGDYCFDLGLDWTRKIKHKDSFETVRVNFDQPELPGMDDGGDVAPSGNPDVAGAKAVRLLGPGPVVDIETTARPVEDLAEYQTCGGCKHLKDEEYCATNPDSLACGDYEEAEDTNDEDFYRSDVSTNVQGLEAWVRETSSAIDEGIKVVYINAFEAINARKLDDLGIIPLIEDNDGYSLLRVIEYTNPVGKVARAKVEVKRFNTKAKCKDTKSALNAYDELLMFFGGEHRVEGKIEVLFRQRHDGSVWMADNHRSWCKADVQDIEVWRARADALEA
jgi:hypothetical protein